MKKLIVRFALLVALLSLLLSACAAPRTESTLFQKVLAVQSDGSTVALTDNDLSPFQQLLRSHLPVPPPTSSARSPSSAKGRTASRCPFGGCSRRACRAGGASRPAMPTPRRPAHRGCGPTCGCPPEPTAFATASAGCSPSAGSSGRAA